MITNIKAKGLKCQSFDEPIAQHQIYVGPNGSGKSARSQAIALATMGYIPWGSSAKKPGDIFKAYGPADGPLTVAVTCEGIELERRFNPTATGASKRLRKNKTRVSDSDFAVALAETGAPKIFDLGAFMKLSDQKKIDELFAIFPPAGDVSAIDGDIEENARLISVTDKEISKLEGTIERLSSSRQDLNLPAGTLAEKDAELTESRQNYKKLSDEIHAEEIRLAEEKAAADAKAKAEADAKLKAEEEARRQAAKEVETKVVNREMQGLRDAAKNPICEPAEKKYQPVQHGPGIIPTVDAPTQPAPDTDPCVVTLEKIARAMELSGCTVCAARLIVKKELSKRRNAQ